MTALRRLRIRDAAAFARIALLVVLAAGLVVSGGHVLHVHTASSPGLYNEQHVLEAAATLTAGAPVPATPAAFAAEAVVAAPTPAAPSIAPAPAVRRADPRAPPSA